MKHENQICSMNYLCMVFYLSREIEDLRAFIDTVWSYSYEIIGSVEYEGVRCEQMTREEMLAFACDNPGETPGIRFRGRLPIQPPLECTHKRKIRVLVATSSSASGSANMRNTAWGMVYEVDPVDCGVKLESVARVSLCLDRLDEKQLLTLSSRIAAFVRALSDILNWYYGLVDVAMEAENAGGNCFGGMTPSWIQPQRLMNKQLWARAGDTRKRVARDVYWGNLLGPDLLDALGGAQRLADDYRSTLRCLPEQAPHCLVLDNGGLFLSLTRDPTSFRRNHPGVFVERGVWLHQRLREANALL